MDRESWWATVHGVTRASDMTEQLTHKSIFLQNSICQHDTRLLYRFVAISFLKKNNMVKVT